MTTAKTVAIMSVLLFALKHCSDENTSIIVDNFNVIHTDKKPLTDQRFLLFKGLLQQQAIDAFDISRRVFWQAALGNHRLIKNHIGKVIKLC